MGAVVVLCFSAECVHAQQTDMQSVSYNLSNVLPTDLIKATVQDGRGFVWAASDAGIVRFDGRHSTLHRNLPSLYVKGFVQTTSGEMLAITDMGLVKIREDADSVRFPIVLRGASVRTDSTLFYPKSLFQASNGDIWIGEQSAVVRLRKGVMKRFPFDARYTTDSFVRSFSFVEELDGTILVSAQRGHGLFRFDVASDRFAEVAVRNTPFAEASAIYLRDKIKRLLWVGTNSGVFELALDEPEAKRSWKQVSSLRDISCLTEDNAGNFYIGTWYQGLHKYHAETGTTYVLSYVDSKTINDIRIATDGNVWVSGDDGITLLHPYTFIKPDVPFQRPFIQHTILAKNGDVLVSDGAAIQRINPFLNKLPHQELLTVIDRDLGSIACLAEHPDGSIWYSTASGFLMAAKNGVSRIVNRQAGERFYFYIYCDKRGTVWACQNPNGQITTVAPDGTTRRYDSSRGMTSSVYVLRESPKGEIFTGGSGENGYIFHYDRNNDRFENLSTSLPFKINEPLSVNDLVVQSDTSVWLATNYGVLHYHNHQTDTIPFSGDVSRRNTLAIALAPQGGIVFATDHGVYMYVRKQLIAVDLRMEKMVMSPSFRCMVIDSAAQLWLGTKLGILVSQQFAKLVPQTRMPTIVLLRANGERVSSEQSNHASGLYLQAEFTSLCYPAEKVRYQTRLVMVLGDGAISGADTTWHEARYNAEEIFPSIASGDYLLQIRAQQEGYLWSEPTQYRFTVQPAWYVRWWAWVLYVLLIVSMMYGAAQYWARHLAKRNRVLQRMVDERTAEIQRQLGILDEQAGEIEIANTRLQEQNLQLVRFNNEKNDFLGIVAHDLKNPLTGIMMTTSMMRMYYDKMTSEELRAQVQRIEDTAHRMHVIITELLDVNAIETGNINISITNVNITQATKNVVEDFRERAVAKRITIHFRSEQDSFLVLADANLIIQILENLVSNAVKYSPHDKNIFVSITRAPHQRVRVAVRDEGPGLSPQDKDKLFLKFAKLSARPTAGEHSTGLGLSIVKRMVEAMHGTVTCESELGQGAAFIVELPSVQTTPTL